MPVIAGMNGVVMAGGVEKTLELVLSARPVDVAAWIALGFIDASIQGEVRSATNGLESVYRGMLKYRDVMHRRIESLRPCWRVCRPRGDRSLIDNFGPHGVEERKRQGNLGARNSAEIPMALVRMVPLCTFAPSTKVAWRDETITSGELRSLGTRFALASCRLMDDIGTDVPGAICTACIGYHLPLP